MTLFFCPASEDEAQGMPHCLTLNDAGQVILTEPGSWYWSEADLAQPKVGHSAEIFTSAEITVQLALDHHLFDPDYAILEEGGERQRLLLTEAVREQRAKKLTSTFVYLDLWQLLELPRPNQVGPQLAKRQERFARLQAQAEAWGDPDLVVALEQINLSADDAGELIKHYGAGMVGGWLRSLRSNPAEIRSLAAVLIARLRRRSIPPGGPMTPIEPAIIQCAVPAHLGKNYSTELPCRVNSPALSASPYLSDRVSPYEQSKLHHPAKQETSYDQSN